MKIDPSVPSQIYFIGIKQDLSGDTLVITSLENKSQKKIQKLIEAHRIIQVIDNGQNTTIKADAALAALLASKQFTYLEIKQPSGNRQTLQSKLEIKTLTAAEATVLNNAVTIFLGSVQMAREEQEGGIKAEEKSDSRARLAAPRGKSRPQKLVLGNYLRERTAKTNTQQAKTWTRALREEEKKAKEHEKEYAERKDTLMRRIKKKEELKWDLNQAEKKKESI